MMKRIRQRFIKIALLALTLAMILVAGVINAVHLVNTSAELKETLNYIVENDNANTHNKQGKYDGDNKENKATADSVQQTGHKGGNHHMDTKVEESRYFIAIENTDGELFLGEGSKEAEYAQDKLLAIAEEVFSSDAASGRTEKYLYHVTEKDDGSRVAVFLNYESKKEEVLSLALISLGACVVGILLSLLLVSLLSKKAIKPMMDNIERQKQFITDAGHELKTPLTAISANMDVLSMDIGPNEWVQGTQKQVANMRKLVNELVYLSRMDEEESALERREFDLSNAVQEVAEPFVGMAEFNGKNLIVKVEDDLTYSGDEAAIRRLISILCENAVKYAPEDTDIKVSLIHSGKNIIFETENAMKGPLSDEALTRLFDRFYRGDESRSKEENKGFGIGLSVARAITEKHDGTIKAKIADNGCLLIICTLPR
ncbi:MAG: GHKL domain-containing protein [Ruminococcus sp.]|nr:GHKL domain-containing protein [Ruminococcus sp.]